MKKVLLVTPQDYKGYSNFRLHHIVDQFTKNFQSIAVIYRYHITEKKPLIDAVRSFFLINSLSEKKDNLLLLRVDPLLNRRQSIGLSMLNITDPYTPPEIYFKRIIQKILSFFGTLTDLLILPSLMFCYFLKLREKYDIVIVQGPWEGAFGYILKKLGLIKLLVYDDRDYEPGFIPTNRFRRKIVEELEKRVLKKADLIVSVGDMLAELRQDMIQVKPVVIPNGVNYKLFRTAQQKLPHRPTLIYMGYINDWSGLELVVDSMVKIRNKVPDVRLLIAGHKNTVYFNYISEKIKGYNLEQDITFLGNLKYSDLINPLKESDVGLAIFKPIDLRKYAFSLKIIEYMAAGLPVITTKGTQSEKVVNKHNCGIAVDYVSDQIAEAVIHIITDHNRYSQFSENAKIAAKGYDWDILIGRYFNFVQNSFNSQI